MVLASIQTVTGAKTFGSAGAVGKLLIAGTTSGAITLDAAAVAGTAVLTLQGTTGTIYSTGGTDVAVADGGTGGSAASITLFNNITGYTASGATGTTSTNLVFSTSPTLVTPTLGVASATSLATSAAIPLLLTNGQLVNIALTSQTVGATTLTIPNFASVVDTFVFITLAQTLANKTLTTPVLTGLPTGTGVATANTASTLVARDASGNFSAGTITASLTGNASGSAATVTGAAQTAITSVGTLTGLTVSGTLSHTNASPFSMTNGQVVTVALTAQTVGIATLTIPDFANVSDTFVFKTKAETLSNKTFVAPALGTVASGVISACTSTSMVMVTPVLGTPTSGVLTNCTGLPVAGGGTGVATLTAYAPVFGGTTGTGAVQSGTAGTSGQVLTSNGAGALPTFQAAGGGTPRFTVIHDMSAVARYSTSNTGTGAVTLVITGDGGLKCNTGATDGSKSSLFTEGSPAQAIYADSPELQAYAVISSDTSTAFVSWILIDGDNTAPSNAGAKTGRHIGYILDTTVLYASNADDTTQTTTDVSAGITMTQDNIYRAVQSGTANIKFYVNKALVATHTTNIKSTGSTTTLIYVGIDNDTGVTTDRFLIISNFNVLFDAQ